MTTTEKTDKLCRDIANSLYKEYSKKKINRSYTLYVAKSASCVFAMAMYILYGKKYSQDIFFSTFNLSVHYDHRLEKIDGYLSDLLEQKID